MMLQRLIKIGVSLALLALLAWLLDWRQAFALLRGTSPVEFLLALALILGAYLANGLRLWRLQQHLEINLAPRLYWGSYAAGLSFNLFLPGGVGGDAVRVLMLVGRGAPLGGLVIAGMADRYLGLLALCQVAALALLVAPEAVPLDANATRLACVALLAASMSGLWLLPRLGARLLTAWSRRYTGRWGSRVGNAADLLRQLFARPWRMVLPLLLSLLSQALFVLACASCARSLLPEMGLAQFFIAVPGAVLLTALPISLGGLGVREAGLVGLLVWMGADAQAALTLSLAFLVINWISVLPGFLAALQFGLGPFTRKANGQIRRT